MYQAYKEDGMKKLHVVLISNKRGSIINLYKVNCLELLIDDLSLLYSKQGLNIQELLSEGKTATNSGLKFQHKTFEY